jgi:Ca2+:H+ antiporter
MRTDGDEHVTISEYGHEEEEEEVLQVPMLTAFQAGLFLVLITVCTGVTAEYLLGSIDGLTTRGGVSRQFLAFILLPLVGNGEFSREDA